MGRREVSEQSQLNIIKSIERVRTCKREACHSMCDVAGGLNMWEWVFRKGGRGWWHGCWYFIWCGV